MRKREVMRMSVAEPKRPRASFAPFTPRTPSAAECTVRFVLDRLAAETPSKPFALFDDGTSWTYGGIRDLVRREAAALVRLGVKPGHLVLNWLPNGPEQLRLWLAANYLGAVHVPIAASYRGGILEHVISNSGARLMVTNAALATRLADIALGGIETLVVLGAEGPAFPHVRVLGDVALDADAADAPDHAPEPWDIAAVIYTSGTTGRSKGVRVPYAQLWTLVQAQLGYMTAEDRMMVMTPLSHISPISGVMAALYRNASVAILERFSTADFWRQLRRTGATAVPGLGPAIMEFLLKAPPKSDDRDNPLRIVNVRAPNTAVKAFAERFDVDYFGSFSMTETACVTITPINAALGNSCGRPRPGVEVRIVDAHDMEVPAGQVGEMVIRTEHPWTLNAGYHNAPEATVTAWRNGWFHTGDAARRDVDDNVFFHDRLKDCIRRRGENISSIEIEREALAHPAVRDAAAIGVAGEFEDQEVLLAVSVRDGASLDPSALIEFMIPRMPYFMVPRFVRVLPELPKTMSDKVRKPELRAAIDLAQCWDRIAEGIILKG
jgi:crotonobetaine/carnitine-CoA ligase